MTPRPTELDSAATNETQSAARAKARRVRELAREHHQYRSSRLNMGCAEAMTSDLVREMLATDFGRRYGTKGGYSGGKFLDEVEAIGESIACQIFGAGYAVLSPITGHVAYEAALAGLTEPGDTVMCMNPEDGGYPTGILQKMGLRPVYFGFDWQKFNLDVDASRATILRERPQLVVFGSPRYLFPHPVSGIVSACREVGATVGYDASHPFGLIAGHCFGDPFVEGVDILFGSTSKTLFGPTRGLILIRESQAIRDRIVSVFTRFILQSTYQLNALAALTISLAETLAFGRAFAQDVVANAVRLAQVLDANGVAIKGRALGFTESQLVLPELSTAAQDEREGVQRRLERAGILADRFVRFGTQQVTRLGMGPSEMERIGDLAAAVIRADPDDSRVLASVEQEVNDLTKSFHQVRYSFGADEDAFQYFSVASKR